MAKIISIIKLCLDLGEIAVEMLKAAIRLYHQYKASMNATNQEQAWHN